MGEGQGRSVGGQGRLACFLTACCCAMSQWAPGMPATVIGGTLVDIWVGGLRRSIPFRSVCTSTACLLAEWTTRRFIFYLLIARSNVDSTKETRTKNLLAQVIKVIEQPVRHPTHVLWSQNWFKYIRTLFCLVDIKKAFIVNLLCVFWFDLSTVRVF